jgi:hypothetical protein
MLGGNNSIDSSSLHRAQILRDLCAMQAKAAEFSGYAENSAAFFFGDNSFEAVCLDSIILKASQ